MENVRVMLQQTYVCMYVRTYVYRSKVRGNDFDFLHLQQSYIRTYIHINYMYCICTVYVCTVYVHMYVHMSNNHTHTHYSARYSIAHCLLLHFLQAQPFHAYNAHSTTQNATPGTPLGAGCDVANYHMTIPHSHAVVVGFDPLEACRGSVCMHTTYTSLIHPDVLHPVQWMTGSRVTAIEWEERRRGERRGEEGRGEKRGGEEREGEEWGGEGRGGEEWGGEERGWERRGGEGRGKGRGGMQGEGGEGMRREQRE